MKKQIILISIIIFFYTSVFVLFQVSPWLDNVLFHGINALSVLITLYAIFTAKKEFLKTSILAILLCCVGNIYQISDNPNNKVCCAFPEEEPILEIKK
jgi:hypothetical protein